MTPPPSATPTLALTDVSVQFPGRRGELAAVRGASLSIDRAQCLGIVGESGSGKTQLFMAVMGLCSGRVAGSIRLEGVELLGRTSAELDRVRGSAMTMVFQDPMTALTPHLRIGEQLAEVLVEHAGRSWRDAGREAARMLERVRIADAPRRLRQYPHELSGGMRQRVMIAMSLLCDPTLLIADEPTTALDVTVQAEILDILRAMRSELSMSIAFISHDIAVVAGIADRVVVMYAGRVVESGPVAELLQRPVHPYTAQLLNCVPNLHGPRLARMSSLAGAPPSPLEPEVGCAFAPRCPQACERCRVERPLLLPVHTRGAEVAAACHFPLAS